MAKKSDEKWDGWVPNLKRLAEELVEDLVEHHLGGPAPGTTFPFDTSVAVACIESAIKGKATANQTIVAAAILAHTEPQRALKVSRGFHKDSVAGWLPEEEWVFGETITFSALGLARLAAGHQLDVGLHGKREPFGYSAMYLLAYLLFAIHEDERLSEMGWRLLKGEISIFRLTRGWEVGCRTNGAVEPSMSAILGVLGVPGFEYPSREPQGDWFATARIFKRLSEAGFLLPWSGDRRIETIQGAVQQLVESGVRCAPGLDFMQDKDGWAQFGLRSTSACEKKGGVCASLTLTPGSNRPERDLGPEHLFTLAWHVVVDASGPRILTSPSGSVAPDRTAKKPKKPHPSPRPEPGEEDLLDPVRAWATSKEAPGGVKKFVDELLKRLEGIKGVPK